jgi:hypothetical protein
MLHQMTLLRICLPKTNGKIVKLDFFNILDHTVSFDLNVNKNPTY